MLEVVMTGWDSQGKEGPDISDTGIAVAMVITSLISFHLFLFLIFCLTLIFLITVIYIIILIKILHNKSDKYFIG